MEHDYSTLKQEVIKQMEDLNEIAAKRKDERVMQFLDDVQQKLRYDRFNLVVLGEFKRGKTTFLNALLGNHILPTGVVPLTSIVTVIEYAESVRIDICFINGGIKQVALDELADYITEAGNPQNVKNVKVVHIGYPSSYLREGVVLIDTPGVGSIYQNNTDETYNYLPKVDAALFVLSADQPISQSECEFLKDIEPYAAKTFFILNKIDYLNEKDQNTALNFARRVLLEKVGIKDIKIFPLSAKWVLEGKLNHDMERLTVSRLPDFTDALETFLMMEKGQTIIYAACHKGIRAACDMLLGLDLEMKALCTPFSELQSKVALFENMVAAISQDEQDNHYILKGEIQKVYHLLEQAVKAFKENKTRQLIKEIEKIYQDHKAGSSRDLLKHMEIYIETYIKTTFETWNEEMEKTIREAFIRVTTRFTEKTNKVVEELLKQSAKLFEIEMEGFTQVETLTDETRLWFKVGKKEGFMLPDPLKLSTLFLPKFISDPMVLREMKRKADCEMDRNCGRIKADYNQRISKSTKQFENLLEEKFNRVVEDTRHILTRAMEQKQKSEKEVTVLLEEIQEQRTRLEKVRSHLLEIING